MPLRGPSDDGIIAEVRRVSASEIHYGSTPSVVARGHPCPHRVRSGGRSTDQTLLRPSLCRWRDERLLRRRRDAAHQSRNAGHHHSDRTLVGIALPNELSRLDRLVHTGHIWCRFQHPLELRRDLPLEVPAPGRRGHSTFLDIADISPVHPRRSPLLLAPERDDRQLDLDNYRTRTLPRTTETLNIAQCYFVSYSELLFSLSGGVDIQLLWDKRC